MTDNAIRWTVIVSRDTDMAVRTHLAQRGMKKGDLSRFIEDAVRRRVFEQTVDDVKARHREVDPGTLEEDIETALREARAERFGEPPRT
jgi:hypothetical protein